MNRLPKELFFFLALLPPPPLQAEITALKGEMGDRYQSHHALKSPPHITLFPPFKWPDTAVDRLGHFANFAESNPSIPVTLSGFGSFPPRVIYIKPLKSSELLAIYDALQDFLEKNFNLVAPMHNKRVFTPHLTIAHRDLSKANFKLAWDEFQGRSFQAEFMATHLTLLQHNGHHWDIYREWPFCQNALNERRIIS